MRWALALIILFMLAPAVSATVLLDAATGNEIQTAFVQVRTESTSRDYLVVPGSPLELENETDKELLILVRVNASETFDHVGKIPAGKIPLGVLVRPSGLVLGDVRDEADNLIISTPISVHCPTHQETLMSDPTGMFRAFLPAGECVLSVNSDNRVGSISVNVQQGFVSRAKITVNTDVVHPPEEPESPITPLIIVLAIIVAGAIIWFMTGKKQEPVIVAEKSENKTSPENKTPLFVVEDVKKALKPKEELIIDEILLRGGTAKLSEIRSATSIPRTSLLRCVEGLEQRGLLLKKGEKSRIFLELIKK